MLDDRFGHTAALLASQVPLADWYLRIPDPTLADALLDRIVHSSHRAEHLRYNLRTGAFLSCHCAACSEFGVRFPRIHRREQKDD